MPDTSKTQDITIPIPDYTIPSEKPKGHKVQKWLTDYTWYKEGKFPSIQIQFVDPLLNQ